jgi:hypothetical protein
MSLAKCTQATPEFRTYGECKRSSSGAGCTAAYAVSDLIDTTLHIISIPPAFAALHVPAGLACRTTKPYPACAEVDSGKHATLAGPSEHVIADSVFDRLVALASVEGVKPKNKVTDKTQRRKRGGTSDNKSKRRAKK